MSPYASSLVSFHVDNASTSAQSPSLVRRRKAFNSSGAIVTSESIPAIRKFLEKLSEEKDPNNRQISIFDPDFHLYNACDQRRCSFDGMFRPKL